MTQKGTKTTKKRVTIYNPEYGLEEFQELRSNREAFFAFMQHFLKQCYIRKWTTKLSNAIKISSILTVSDEAFVLLILENNWDRWMDLNKKSDNKYVPSKRGSENPIVSDVKPMYTNINGRAGSNEVNRGWSKEGIKRFNVLCGMVKEDREENEDGDKELLEQMKPLIKTQSRKRAKLNNPITKAYVDIEINDDGNSSEGSSSDDSDN